MSAFKNILLVGAGGSIGSIVLEALLKESSFTVTILQRASSKTAIPDGVRSIKVADDYPTAELEAAFRGQEAIVNCMTSLSVIDQFRFIDAAVAVGVRRYLPSEYGLNNMRKDAQALSTVFRDKGRVQERLRELAAAGRIEWTSVSCGMWIRWSLAHEFLGLHLKERRAVLWDDGEGLCSCTTEENTALALVRALSEFPEETRNQNVLLSDFAVSQRQMVAELERQTGGEPWKVEKLDSVKFIEEQQKLVEGGNVGATFALIETGFLTGRYGGHLELEGDIFNEKLGLKKHTLEDVIASALKALK
ncbi:hypothetical protein GGTG_08710 [Gaeumannomyces tritici R3-111a-1]|uniref:NmrA-like domain-containing protein n=1 Tax=Gaeumannomyces tritici (strain R3-111a-1) TaxID=644352 RepID=J3P5C1_GAET3|nr:hypothetical protein GGTG_08710 [Gaeumannomyces tritici R3-111a-1]EJT74872.1 hypothetical protein GGTG_08710 [Gaeumannomyces tritici R3-111a-1]